MQTSANAETALEVKSALRCWLVCRIDPIAYIQIALAVNEFNAPRWLNLPVGNSLSAPECKRRSPEGYACVLCAVLLCPARLLQDG